jgi:hypothetical protein
MDNNVRKLPALPGSDNDSIAKNRFDGFYKVGSRDFWREQELNHIDLTGNDFKKCEHYFKRQEAEVICERCHSGYLGNDLEIRDGKLFARGEPLGI